MRAERLGSYSIVRTVAGTPSLLRFQSTIRYSRLAPPPRWRTVMRPMLLRPPVFLSGCVSDFSGRVAVISSKVKPLIPRRPGEVGLYCCTGTLHPLVELDATARLECHDRLFPVTRHAGGTGTAGRVPHLALHVDDV